MADDKSTLLILIPLHLSITDAHVLVLAPQPDRPHDPKQYVAPDGSLVEYPYLAQLILPHTAAHSDERDQAGAFLETLKGGPYNFKLLPPVGPTL